MGSQDVMVPVVNNHMVIISPVRIGLWDPFQVAFYALQARITNYLLAGMIFPVRFF